MARIAALHNQDLLPRQKIEVNAPSVAHAHVVATQQHAAFLTIQSALKRNS
jgi:hypothetical protein